MALISVNAEVVISEFLSSNGSSLLDEDGDASDWIEIHNPTASPVQLFGYFLTDDAGDLEQWSFPAVTVEAGGYLVVFASGKDRSISGSELHTDFSLSAGGEYLALVKPNGLAIVTEYSPEYPEQQENISYGYSSVDGGNRFFQTPTPGAANTGAFSGFVGDTAFSADRGFYDTPFTVEITTATNGAVIRYTLDGTEPDANTGLIYSSPIQINGTTVLRAAAFKSDYLPTNVDTQTYIFAADVLTQPDMRTEVTNDPAIGPQLVSALTSVPTIALSFEGDDIDRTEIPLSVELLNFESGSKQLDAGAARFGSFVTDFEKRSFRLHFRSEYGSSRLNFPLFNNRDYAIPAVDSFNSLDVRAGNHDMILRGAYLANPFTDDTMIEMGYVAPHGRFVHIYFNGEYRGMYHLRERWSADMLASYLPGGEDEYNTINANNSGREFQTGALQDGDLNDWNDIQDGLVSTPRFDSVKDLLNLNNYIDFMTVFTGGNSESEFRAGGSVENGEGFIFFLKDGDGYLRSGDLYPATHNGPLDAMTLLRNEAAPEFMTLLGDRLHCQLFNDGAMTPAANSARLVERIEEARLPYLAEYARWENHDNRTARTPEEWEDYQQFFLDTEFPALADRRIDLYRDANMYPDLTAPTYSQHGGSLGASGLVTLTVPSNVSRIYYQTGPVDTDPDIYRNSLDPRMEGGVVHLAANMIDLSGGASGTVTLIDEGDSWKYLDNGSNQGTAWRANSFNDSAWASGASPLGYGDDNLATTVSFGGDPNNKHITTYFRKTFNVENLSALPSLALRYQRDDGVAIYLNGVEIVRDNLVNNANSSEEADGAINNAGEVTFHEVTLSAGLLQAGANTLAVEIHQAAPTSSDIRFNAELVGNSPGVNGNQSFQIALSEPGWLLARSYDASTGEWSALNKAFFSLTSVPADASNLVVSKIHYNPADPVGAELVVATDADDFEFIELMNVGSEAIDLSGVTIGGGISFNFGEFNELPSGSRVVIVENKDAFDARYASSLPSTIFAIDPIGESQYGGKLSNGGEQIIVTDAMGRTIHDFSYGDSSPWPSVPDGSGYALVLRNPETPIPDHAIAANWAASAGVGGSPGGGSDTGLVGDPHADDDGDGFTALLEYALGSSDAVANDSTINGELMDFVSGANTVTYPTLSFVRNHHALNAVDVIVETSIDLQTWTPMLGVVEVSETDNGNDTSTVLYRSAVAIGDQESGKEFMRIRVVEID